MIKQNMSTKDWAMLLLLSFLWGGSFFFIGIAVTELPPFTIVTLRVSLAAITLWLVLLVAGYPIPKGGDTWRAFFVMGLLFDDLSTAILVCIIPGFAGNYAIGPAIAMVQTLSPVHMRAVSSAIKMLCLNLIGMGLGPLLVGLLSDLLTPQHGEDALRVALAFFTLVGLWGTVHFWLCARALAKQQLDTE